MSLYVGDTKISELNLITNSTYQNLVDGNTVAMWLAYNDCSINECWYHDPNLQNC